jgi:predicted ferric reductase
MSTTLSAPAGPDTAGTASLSRHPLAPARPTSRRWWRDAAGSLTWLSLLAVVGLWVKDGGLQHLGSIAGLLKGTGDLTGLVASDLLLIQVLLMARIPFVERVYGQDELARRHRLAGFTSFNLMIAHIVLITLGYSAGSNAGVVSTFVEMVATYPGMLIATAGTLFLVLVVVTSVRAARAKLRYESWHLLHLYAYLGVGLALPHQLWTGADFLASPLATGYWWTLWALAAVAVLQFRVAVPLRRSLRHRLVVAGVDVEGAGVVSVRMTGRHLDRLAVRAGQYFVWRFLDGPGWTRGHPYSLSAAPDGRGLRITVKALGDDSACLATLRPGTRVLIEGPYGRLSGDARTRRHVTFVASGIGITPMRAMIEEFPYRPGEATLIYRVSRMDDVPLRRELDALAERRGVRVWYVPGHRSGDGSWMPAGQEHLDPARALLQLAPDLPGSDVYVCGPQAWMDAVRDASVRAGAPVEQVHLERFGF